MPYKMKQLLNKLFTKYFLKIVHPDDIILISKKGQVYLDGVQVSEQKLAVFIEGATLLKTSPLLKSILSTMRDQAEKNILYKGTTQEIVHNNRITLHVIGQIESMISIFKGYRGAIEKQEEFVKASIPSTE